MNKTKKTFWVLKRPHLYSHAFRYILNKIIGTPNDSKKAKDEAEKWCANKCVSTSDALNFILNEKTFVDINKIHASFLNEALKSTSICPIKMGGPGNLNLLYHCAESIGATRVVETGVAYGWSSLALLLSLNNRRNSQLVSVDMPYPGLDNDAYVGCAVPTSIKSNWTLIRRPDRAGLPAALRQLGQVDMCHYDSDKSYGGRMWAYPILWNALRSGGLFISDDISDNLAFRDFCISLNLSPIIISFDGKYAGVLRKK